MDSFFFFRNGTSKNRGVPLDWAEVSDKVEREPALLQLK